MEKENTSGFFILLNEFNSFDIKNAVNYEIMNEILISHHSTAIEGSSLTEQETRLLLTDGITAKGKPLEDHNMVTDHHKALLDVVRMAKEKIQITPQFIQNISALVMSSTGGVVNTMAGSYDSSKGEFRKGAVHVGDRYFTNYLKVPREVQTLCDDINAQIDKVKTPEEIYNLAFDAHFGLVSIHPFADGNGRTSRLLMNYILEYHGQPMALIFKEDKLDYFKALEQSREQESYTPFRNFMYAQQAKHLSTEISKIQQDTCWKFENKL
ncbi:cell filamentation protein Fic [Bacteroidia bacterium]|nr:cell filamentation protein Fic [Bacteroidia bacterium]